jgi:uncharacterized membrane protein YgdD (TMEM256/DUF423 family)
MVPSAGRLRWAAGLVLVGLLMPGGSLIVLTIFLGERARKLLGAASPARQGES